MLYCQCIQVAVIKGRLVWEMQRASGRAQAQISGLKLEMEASTVNLTLEKQQLQSAQERIMLRYVHSSTTLTPFAHQEWLHTIC